MTTSPPPTPTPAARAPPPSWTTWRSGTWTLSWSGSVAETLRAATKTPLRQLPSVEPAGRP